MRRVFVDSSAWIEFGRGTGSPAALALRRLVEARDPFRPPGEDGGEAAEIILGDLVLAEVLRGLTDEREYRAARDWLLSFEVVRLGGTATALAAIDNYRALRRLGITIRKTIDCLIAAWCIEHEVPLLHSDRDFVPFVDHRGLVAA